MKAGDKVQVISVSSALFGFTGVLVSVQDSVFDPFRKFVWVDLDDEPFGVNYLVWFFDDALEVIEDAPAPVESEEAPVQWAKGDIALVSDKEDVQKKQAWDRRAWSGRVVEIVRINPVAQMAAIKDSEGRRTVCYLSELRRLSNKDLWT